MASGARDLSQRGRNRTRRTRDDEPTSGIALREEDDLQLFDEQGPAEDTIQDPMRRERLSEDLEDPLRS